MTTLVEVNTVAEPISKMAFNPPAGGIKPPPVPATESKQAPLFACTKCNTRHPFEDLSKDMMFCKACQEPSVMIKCKYCRSEFKSASKSMSICSKCDYCVKKFGKPTTCDYCNIIAAFVGKKCHRCTHSEKKYGPPMQCEQCKQRSAFDRRDADGRSKNQGHILCWLCTCAYKRAMAKAKQRKDGQHITKEPYHKRDSYRTHSSRSKSDFNSKSLANGTNGSNGANGSSADPSPTKKLRLDSSASAASTSNQSAPVPIPLPGTLLMDPSTDSMSANDNVVTIAQLREQVLLLNRQLKAKQQELLKKDVKITELNAEISKEQRDCREKVQDMQKKHQERVQELQHKISSLSKQLASSQKEGKKKTNGATTNEDPF